MSLKQWALSVFFVWHLIATVLGAFASSDEDRSVVASSQPPTDPLAAIVTPVLDRIAAAVAPLPGALARTSAPFRRMTTFYLQITGLGQNWKMFSGPPKVHRTMRVRYYVGPRGDIGGSPVNPTWFATELVEPAHREDQVRFLQSYRDSFRDKAMAIALSRFRRARDAGLIRRDTTSAELPDDLAPIARYFARRFEIETSAGRACPAHRGLVRGSSNTTSRNIRSRSGPKRGGPCFALTTRDLSRTISAAPLPGLSQYGK